MAERLILCSGCGAKNRIPQDRRGQPKCGSCGKPLSVPGYSARRGFFKKALIFLIVGGLIVGGYYFVEEYKGLSSTTTNTKLLRSFDPVQKSDFNAPRVPVSAGVMQRPSNAGVAPLAISTHAGNDYYVKLVDLGGRVVMTMYVEGGRYFETSVPLGTYEMRYASGKVWYGTRHHFGPETSYAKAEQKFEFQFDGSRYSGYKIELIMQSGGNLTESRLSRNEF